MKTNPNGLEIYKYRTGWRWRIWSEGVVEASGKRTYKRRIDLLNAIETVLSLMPASMVDGVSTTSGDVKPVKVRVTRRKYK